MLSTSSSGAGKGKEKGASRVKREVGFCMRSMNVSQYD